MNFRGKVGEWIKPRIWWWIVAATGLHICFWTFWFMIAAHHSVADVPLANLSAR